MDDKLSKLVNYRYKGLATSCGDTNFDLPLVSQIEGNLWMGASVGEFGFEMSPYFASILNLYPWVEYYVPKGVEYYPYELYDNHSAVNDETIWNLARWVDSHLIEGPVLVHCQAGINRSSLVVGATLVLQGKTGREAIDLIRKNRGPECLCNHKFEEWLLSQSA